MRCAEFDIRLNDQLDARRLPHVDPELCAHAAGCQSCRETLAASEAMLAGLDACLPPEPPAGLPDRVLDSVRVAGRPRRSPHIAALLALAAALLVAVGWQFLRGGQTLDGDVFDGTNFDGTGLDGGTPIAAPHPAAPGTPPAATEMLAADVPAADVLADDVLAKGRSPGDWADPHAQTMVMFRRTGAAMAVLPYAVRSAAGQPQVERGFRPVAHSLTAAIDALRQALPSKTGDAPSENGAAANEAS